MTEEERRQREILLKSQQGQTFPANIFSMMGDNLQSETQKIDRREYDRLKGNPIYNVDKQSGTMFGSVNPHGNMGVKPVYNTDLLGGQGSMAGDSSSTENITGYVPTNTTSRLNTIQPKNAISDAPKRNLDFNKYSKSMDKTFMMAALQSAIPKNDETPARQAPSSGGRGGGNRMDQMRQYASAIKLDDEDYPGLWRYS